MLYEKMSQMNSPDIFAWLATLFITLSYAFQIYKGYRTRHLRDVSWLFLVAILLGCMMWVVYGVEKDDATFLITNVLITSLVMLLCALKLYFQNCGETD